MPTACAKVEKQNSIESTEPFKQVQVLVEKKIRNLEKRKTKLEQLKQDQETGKALHDDQKKAIKRFDEVNELLEFFREFNKSIATIFTDHAKVVKKQQKKEQLERQQQDVDRFRNVILFQDLLNKLGNSKVRNDFALGTNGALQLTETQLSNLDELRKSITTDLNSINVPGAKELEAYGERLSALIDGKTRDAFNGTTYKDMKELLVKLSECNYFNKSISDSVETEEKNGNEEEDENTIRTTGGEEKFDHAEQVTEINERLAATTVTNDNQTVSPNVFNVIPNYDNNPNDPAVIAIGTTYTTAYSCVPGDGLTHGIGLSAAAQATQKVNFDDVNSHQPIPTQTFTNQNYSFQPVPSMSQPNSLTGSPTVVTGGVPQQPPVSVVGVPQSLSPHPLHSSTSTSPLVTVEQQAQVTQQQLITQTHAINNYQDTTAYGGYPMEGHVEGTLTSHESGMPTFGGDEQTFAQNQPQMRPYQRKEGYRGRGGMRGNSRPMNPLFMGLGGGRGGHKQNNFGNNYGAGSNGSYFKENRPNNYGNRPTKPAGNRGGAPGASANHRHPQSGYGGYQGKPQHQQQQHQHPQQTQQQQ